MCKLRLAVRGLLLTTLFAAAAVTARAQSEAQQFPVATKTLKNGMKVLVQTDHSIPSVDANNGGILDEQLKATAFLAHPYQWPVIGWMSDIEHWTMEDLKHHFEMGYAPNNATMVVVGDVTPEEIFKLCEKYIEPIPQHAPPPPVTTVEPEQMGERRLIVRKPAELPLLMIGYHVPRTNNPDFYALNIMRTVLAHGE